VSEPLTERRTRARDRARGRELALARLYAWEQRRFEDDPALPDELIEGATDAARAYADQIVAGVGAQRTPLDAAIDRRLENWTLHRLAAVDRALLRLAAWEILYADDMPPRVAINEAIELAKRYGSDERTAKLVNGVLDRIAREHRPEGMRAGPAAGKGSRED
jgi:N utilization substance protein B